MPFLRLIIPLITGILIQFYFGFSIFLLSLLAGVSVVLISIFFAVTFLKRYYFGWLAGIAVNLLLIVMGALIVLNNDIRNKKNWIGNFDKDSIAVLATIEEPLVEKAKSYKAEASVATVFVNGKWQEASGKILLYFAKDSNLPALKYGSQVLFYKTLRPIKNSGNPGSFDYRQYSALQGIYHQVFLKNNEYKATNTTAPNVLTNQLFDIRNSVIRKLQQYIQGNREAGVAEALLIGYRNDLDKDLVQAYSNTGVVHIIAISGMHLGMIYGALIFLFKPFKKYQWTRWVKPIVILAVLWIFTLLAGAVPSILRSAVMFTFIVLGEAINRKSSIFNTLAASAFVMLCIDPYYLWDVGFQLSYAAVVGIVLFSKPVYNWFYIRNKLIDFSWKLTSVTISAQILTLPIIFYAFHQFPNLFLITNCVIVPLSSIILFAELILLISSFFPVLASITGFITGKMLAFMNGFIEWINKMPFAVYDEIQNNIAETILLYFFIISICYWLLIKNKSALFAALASALIFIIFDGYENFVLMQQQKIIVYNIPKHNAIDFIAGKKYAFVGDTALLNDGYLINFNLKPSRTLHRIKPANNLKSLFISHPFVQFQGKRILMIDRPFKFHNPAKIPVDLIVISNNAGVYVSELANVFDCKQYVFDGSNSFYKINRWKKDCDSLHLPHYSTPDKGAFEWNL